MRRETPVRTPELEIDKTQTVEQAGSNRLYVEPGLYRDFLVANGNSEPIYVTIANVVDVPKYPYILGSFPQAPRGKVLMGQATRVSLKLSPTLDKPQLELYEPNSDKLSLASVRFVVEDPQLRPDAPPVTFDESFFIEHIKNNFKHHFIGTGQTIYGFLHDRHLMFKAAEHQFYDQNTHMVAGMIGQETQIEVKSSQSLIKIKSASMKQKVIFNMNFKFENLGVGGLDTQMVEIFRRAFSTRRIPPAIAQKLGTKHCKGVLLYGPPGTGKTLIAQELAKCLQSTKIQKVNGPELLSKYVGESEENVRKLFAEAQKDQKSLGDDSPLHVIIFDEFDALAKPRGMDSDSTGVAGNVVNQLLSMIDGVDALNNILLIAMTNRKDMIDPAILRPGRFEIHIEIGLPDENGRVQIFKIHTRAMKENGILDPDVDIVKLAAMTKNYSGAEIESLVKSANSHSLNRHHDLLDFQKELKFTGNETVNMADFMKALQEVKPDFGVDNNRLESRLRGKIISYGPRYEKLDATLKDFMQGFISSELDNNSILLYGSKGSGTSSLACRLAKDSNIPYVKLISSEDLISYGDFGKMKFVQNIFNNAYRSKSAIIILDDIERLLEYVRVGARFNSSMLNCLITCLKKRPEQEGGKIIIIGTTSSKEVLRELGVWEQFNIKQYIPNLSGDGEIQRALLQMCPAARNIDKMSLNKDDQLPIKELYFIASMINQKLNQNPNQDPAALYREFSTRVEFD